MKYQTNKMTIAAVEQGFDKSLISLSFPKKQRYTLMYVLRLLFLLVILPSYYTVAGAENKLKSPRVEMKDISLTSIDFSGAQVSITLAVHNPNAIDIEVESIQYSLVLNNVPVKKGVIRQKERFPAQQRREVMVPVAVTYDEHLPELLSALNSANASTYEISGSVQLKGEGSPFPFHHKGSLALANVLNFTGLNSAVIFTTAHASLCTTEVLL